MSDTDAHPGPSGGGRYFGAIDQGTTSTRAMRFGPDRQLRTVLQLSHAMYRPAPDRVEMDAAELARNVAACADALGGVEAVGLANQGESCLAWDARTGEPLSPVVSWQDGRTADTLRQMAADGLATEVLARSGLPLDPYFSAAKLGWLLAELPAVAAAHAGGRLRLGTSDAFLLDTLAGRFATDVATASRTGLTSLATGNWDPELCALFGVPIETLPPILPTLGDFGTLAGRPVRAAIVDQQAALYGHGCRLPGELKLTLGTGGFALAPCETAQRLRAAAVGLVPTVAWDLGDGPVHALDAAVPDVATALDWSVHCGFAANVGACDPEAPLIATTGLVALPLFTGLGCPDWERGAPPLILGYNPDTSGADLARATLEGVAWLCAPARLPRSPLSSSRADRCGSMAACRAMAHSCRRSAICPDASWHPHPRPSAPAWARPCSPRARAARPSMISRPTAPMYVRPRPVPDAAHEALARALTLARHAAQTPPDVPETAHG